jgi:hypothetical protein
VESNGSGDCLSATGCVQETATFEAQYSSGGSSKLPCTNLTGNTDCVLWGSTTLGNQHVGGTISFSSGDTVALTLYNAEDWDITTTISASQTPLPATLPLFVGGLSVMGLLGWRRKQKAAAIAV